MFASVVIIAQEERIIPNIVNPQGLYGVFLRKKRLKSLLSIEWNKLNDKSQCFFKYRVI